MQPVKLNVGWEIVSLQVCSCRIMSCKLQPLPKNSCCPVGISPSAGADTGEANVTWILWAKIHWSNWGSDYTHETSKNPGIPEAYQNLRLAEHLPWQLGMVAQWCWSIFCVCCRNPEVLMSHPQCSEVPVVPSVMPLGMPVWCLEHSMGDWLFHTCTGLNTQYLFSRNHFTFVPGQGSLGGTELLHTGARAVSHSGSLRKGNRDWKDAWPSRWWAWRSPGVPSHFEGVLWFIWGWTCLLHLQFAARTCWLTVWWMGLYEVAAVTAGDQARCRRDPPMLQPALHENSGPSQHGVPDQHQYAGSRFSRMSVYQTFCYVWKMGRSGYSFRNRLSHSQTALASRS